MNSSFYPLVMGIVNVNNESFYESSRVTRCSDFLQRIDSMINSGAKIIDIGGCSTRPGSIPVSLEQEWEYIEEPLLMLKGRDLKGVLISIDTFRSDIVKRAHKVIGNFIVNDISAGEDDNLMLQTIGELGLTYIAMHKRGTPSTMVNLCDYPNGVTNEIIDYFTLFHKKAMRFGIKNYIIDPGLGFAKTIEQIGRASCRERVASPV